MRQTYVAARMAPGCSSIAHETLEFVQEIKVKFSFDQVIDFWVFTACSIPSLF
jgi:hypothetical protein